MNSHFLEVPLCDLTDYFCSVCMVNIRRKNAKNPKVSEKYVVFVTNVPIRDTRQYVARWGGGGWEIETGIN